MGKRAERTLIVVRRTQADPRAIWAGGIPQPSFATLRTWMAPFNVERAISRCFDPSDFGNIVRFRGGQRKARYEMAGNNPKPTQ